MTAKSNKNKLHSFASASMGDKVFYVFIGILLTFSFVVVLYPCIVVLSSSFSSGTAVSSGQVVLFPVGFNLDGYRTVFSNKNVISGFINSFIYTISGTALNILVTVICAYCLSRRDLPGRNGFMFLFTFTMLFSGGMIASYLLIRSLNMVNTRWVMIIPGAMSVYNMIIAKT